MNSIVWCIAKSGSAKQGRNPPVGDRPDTRSLQFTIFGDLDVSIMDRDASRELPVDHIVYRLSERVYQTIRKQVKRAPGIHHLSLW